MSRLGSKGPISLSQLVEEGYKFITIIALASLLALSCKTASAQATSGTLTGIVTDPSGAVVANATVTINDTQHGTSVSTTTNWQGLFTRTQLANGT